MCLRHGILQATAGCQTLSLLNSLRANRPQKLAVISIHSGKYPEVSNSSSLGPRRQTCAHAAASLSLSRLFWGMGGRRISSSPTMAWEAHSHPNTYRGSSTLLVSTRVSRVKSGMRGSIALRTAARQRAVRDVPTDAADVLSSPFGFETQITNHSDDSWLWCLNP